MRSRIYVWCILALVLVVSRDFRQDSIAIATAPHQFSLVSWELSNLPDKWARRVFGVAGSLASADDSEHRNRNAQRFFAIGSRLREIDRLMIATEASPQPGTTPAPEVEALRKEQRDLLNERETIRTEVEETLESATAAALRELGFGTRAGVFPPVDTVLTGSPTVLILSPRHRIARLEGGLLQPGLSASHRERIETTVESDSGLSALVVNTGGIALYPSIALDDAGMDHALDTIAHEWVHHWLWFRPLGRRYFEGGDLTTLNETVASIAGAEVGRLARQRLEGGTPAAAAGISSVAANGQSTAGDATQSFDFQAEMRATRTEVDRLLSSGDVTGAEAYMEVRRRRFVAEGYPIRKLNQAYFAFYGAYATTGAAGVSIIGEQVQELRRRSASLADFLRTAAQITSAQDLERILNGRP